MKTDFVSGIEKDRWESQRRETNIKIEKKWGVNIKNRAWNGNIKNATAIIAQSAIRNRNHQTCCEAKRQTMSGNTDTPLRPGVADAAAKAAADETARIAAVAAALSQHRITPQHRRTMVQERNEPSLAGITVTSKRYGKAGGVNSSEIAVGTTKARERWKKDGVAYVALTKDRVIADPRNDQLVARSLKTPIRGVTFHTGDTEENRLETHEEAMNRVARENAKDLRDHSAKAEKCQNTWGRNLPGDYYNVPRFNCINIDPYAHEWTHFDPDDLFENRTHESLTKQEAMDWAYQILMEDIKNKETVEKLMKKVLPWSKEKNSDKTVAWGMTVILRFVLMLNQKSITAEMLTDIAFTETTKPQKALSDGRKCCLSWMVQAVFINPRMNHNKYTELVGLMEYPDQELVTMVILPLVSAICFHCTPPRG